MNAQSLLACLLILSLGACSASGRMAGPRATQADPTTMPQPTTPPAYENPRERSPDGYWRPTLLTPTASGAAWFASPSGNCEVRTTIPPEFGAYSLLAAWSPDSNHVAFFGYPAPFRGPPTQIMIIEFDRRGCIGLVSTVDLKGYLNSSEAVWAPDSSRIATVVDSRDIVILDQKAKVTVTFAAPVPMPVPERGRASGLEWVGSDLAYTITDLKDSPNIKYVKCMLSAGSRCR